MAARTLTIGYAGTDPERFFAALHAAGATKLLDVRSSTRSGKKGFNHTRLRAGCTAAGITYVHLPRCGAPRAARDRYLDDGDWPAFAAAFEAHLQAHPEIVDELETEATRPSTTAAILCVCREAERCHRGLLTAHLERRGHVVGHLRPAPTDSCQVAEDPARATRFPVPHDNPQEPSAGHVR